MKLGEYAACGFEVLLTRKHEPLVYQVQSHTSCIFLLRVKQALKKNRCIFLSRHISSNSILSGVNIFSDSIFQGVYSLHSLRHCFLDQLHHRSEGDFAASQNTFFVDFDQSIFHLLFSSEGRKSCCKRITVNL